jgi:hypothetical protein
MKYISFIVIFLGCTNGPPKGTVSHVEKDTTYQTRLVRDSSSINMHDAYGNDRDTIRRNAAMNTIYNFPEVKELDKLIRKSSKGAHGVSFIVEDEFEGDTSYYHFSVGDNSHEEKYEKIFDFLLEKKTGQIKVYDSAKDSIMSVQAWRKLKISS